MEHRDLIDKLLHSQKWEQTQGLIVQTIHSYLEELFRLRRPNPRLSYADLEVMLEFYTFGMAGLLLKHRGRSAAELDQLADQAYRLMTRRDGPGRVEPAGSGRSPDIGLAPYSVPNLGKIARFFPFSAGCGVSKAMV